MSNPLEMLEVIEENDNVVGLETRVKIHQDGLLHREIHIWFLTPKAEIIFQHRAKDKDTYPDKLDATVGGHVEPKMSYEETAVKECKEETGIDIDLNKEEGMSQGFVAWKIDDLSHLSGSDKNKFVPLILKQDMLDIFNEAQKILLK